MTKVLYVSSNHPVLEYDDLTVFNELGVDWFSTGIYIDPQHPLPLCKRRAMNIPQNEELAEAFYADNPNFNFDPHLAAPPNVNLTDSFLDRFDIVIVNNFFHFLQNNWKTLRNRKTFFRSYYYSNPAQELKLSGMKASSDLKLIRMFPQELGIPNTAGADYVIQNYVDPEEYKGWTGEEEKVLTFQNDMLVRLHHRDQLGLVVFDSYHAYLNVVKSMGTELFDLYGYNNRIKLSKGVVSWDEQKSLYQKSRCFFSLGSKPGPYTYTFLEAMATGMPTINFGHGFGDYKHPWYKGSYIVPEIVTHGENGFVSDDLNEIADIIRQLMSNKSLAKSVSENARQTVVNRFSKDISKDLWKGFFEKEL